MRVFTEKQEKIVPDIYLENQFWAYAKMGEKWFKKQGKMALKQIKNGPKMDQIFVENDSK